MKWNQSKKQQISPSPPTYYVVGIYDIVGGDRDNMLFLKPGYQGMYFRAKRI